MAGLSFVWHHLFYQNYLQYGCQILHLLLPPNHYPYSLPRFQVLSPLLSSFAIIIMIIVYLTSDPVVWRFLQSSSPNQVHLDMCPPCLCTKCPPHVEQNGLFAISFSNLPESMNLPTMTDMLNDDHHVDHRQDHLTRSCHLAWRYSATWWSATRFSASTRSTCQIKR